MKPLLGLFFVSWALWACDGMLGAVGPSPDSSEGVQAATVGPSGRPNPVAPPNFDAGLPRETPGVFSDAGSLPPREETPPKPAIDDGYGVPVDGYPNWQERTILVLTNGVRAGPKDWKDKYMSNLQTTDILHERVYPPVPPLAWNQALNQVARMHSQDMSKPDCGFSHECYGKNHLQRISEVYGGSNKGENIAAGLFNSPLQVVNLWVCESATQCLPDGMGDGHRSALMARGFRELGVGHFQLSVYKQFYTQDFGGGLYVPEHLIVSATHLLAQGKLRFFANLYDSRGLKPRSLKVVTTSATVDLTLQVGTESNGMYVAETSTPSSCEEYYFEAVDDSGQTWRYPSRGRFLAYGMNGCSNDYAP